MEEQTRSNKDLEASIGYSGGQYRDPMVTPTNTVRKGQEG